MSANTWSLSIEFTGLFVLTTTSTGKLIGELLDDARHVPVLTCRALDLAESLDCGPVHKVTDVRADGATLALFPIRRGAVMSATVKDANPTSKVNCDPSLEKLADLRYIFGRERCPMEHDSPRFVFDSYTLSAGRIDPKLEFLITKAGAAIYEGPLALSVVYRIDGIQQDAIVELDLHPGTLRFAYTGSDVSMGISNLPVVQVRDSNVVHFDEYGRLLDSTDDIMVTLPAHGRFIDDPVHCVPARLL